MNLINQEFKINNDLFFKDLKKDQEYFQVYLFRNDVKFRKVQESIFFQTEQVMIQRILQFLLHVIIDQPLPIEIINKNKNFNLNIESLNFLYYFLNISVCINSINKTMKPILPLELYNKNLEKKIANFTDQKSIKQCQKMLNKILGLDTFNKTYQFYQLINKLIKDQDNIFWKNYQELYINYPFYLEKEQKLEEVKQQFKLPKILQIMEDKKLEVDFCQNIIITENPQYCHMAIYDQNIIQDLYQETKLCQNKNIYFKGQVNEAKDMIYGDLYQRNQDLIYRGSFQYNRPHGIGFQRLKINQSIIIYEGTFFFGFKQGQFKTYLENDEQSSNIIYFQKGFEGSPKPQSENYFVIASTQLQYLNYSTMNTLIPGRWLQEKVIDLFLEKCINYYKIVEQKEKIGLFNTLQWQDIFGSQIRIQGSYKNNVNIKEMSKIIQMNYDRTIFAINHNRCHFQVIVIEKDKKVYILNSLQSDDDRKLVEFIVSCNSNELNSDIEQCQVNVPQQNNCYDCGVHACYNIIKLIENNDTQIHQIDFSIKGNNLNKFRRFIYDIAMNQADLTQIKQK